MSRDPEKTVCRTAQSGLALEGGKAEPFLFAVNSQHWVNMAVT